MCQFIESILLKDDNIPFLQWHEHRFKNTQMAVWGKLVHPRLSEIIRSYNLNLDKKISYKCRIVYNHKNIEVSTSVYNKKEIKSLIVVEANNLDYHLKYADRTALNILGKNIHSNNEILIVKNGLLTDTSFTNIALWNGTEWHTPAHPLLQGVHRQKLIEEGTLIAKDITPNTINKYQSIRLINAMNFWENTWELNVNEIEQNYYVG